jgi:hypothetical protein
MRCCGSLGSMQSLIAPEPLHVPYGCRGDTLLDWLEDSPRKLGRKTAEDSRLTILFNGSPLPLTHKL